MFLMLTPVLACVMTFCPVQASAATTSGQIPCHETNGDIDAKDGLMLAIDCMDVDLFQQDSVNVSPPNQSIDSVDYVWAEIAADYNFSPADYNFIRGPPDRPDIAQAEPSLSSQHSVSASSTPLFFNF